MKTTFITTVFNEEKTISTFLQSLFSQTKLPNEIIIVDAKSTDKTVEKISEFPVTKDHKIKLIIKKGNRSIGRNTAIDASSGDIIICSDGGCILDKNFIKNLTKPFKKNDIDVVSGFYKPVANNIFEKCLATYTCVFPDKINKKNFLPSARSMAFRKSIWKKIQGFPENLDTCEDLVFDKKLQEKKTRFCFVEDAFVYWPQRKNIWEATKQFFSYAKGDGKARFFRKQTPLLFLRYLIGITILSVGLQFHKPQLFLLLGLGFCLYILWAIWKNYKYVQNLQAAFWLPVLQLISDTTVLIGTSIGYIQSFNILKKIKQNKILTAIIFVYIIIELTGLIWGIPNSQHPFTYNMDEWAQAQSIRALFKHGTPNISGASHGAIFHYFFSGIYLIPFFIFGIVNPLAIKSSFAQIAMQQRLFEVLRINTILFGIDAIIMLAIILKKFWKINPIFGVIFFTITPIWITLSNYFKYDIALIFWILVALYFIFNFSEKPTKKNFLIAGFFSGLTLATKLSALPMFFLYIFSFFLFKKKFIKEIKNLFLGIGIFILTFLVLGIPDFLISKKEYVDWWNANLQIVPQTTQNMQLGKPWSVYLFWNLYLGEFGHVFYIIFIFSVIFLSIFIIKIGLSKYKKEIFLFASFILFLISLFPLKVFASGNRALVLLPFLAFITAIAFTYIKKYFSKKSIYILGSIFFILTIIQILEVFAIVTTRFNDPRTLSSTWIEKNIPKKTTIGLENVPIFQMEPDIILNEFYKNVYDIGRNNRYTYQIVDANTTSFPHIIVISNDFAESQLYKKTPKKDLINKLKKIQYKKIATFSVNNSLARVFEDSSYFLFPLYLTPDTISIYKK